MLKSTKPTIVSIIFYEALFLFSGFFQTLGQQFLYYQGAATGLSLLTNTAMYMGMAAVGFFLLPKWLRRRKSINDRIGELEVNMATATGKNYQLLPEEAEEDNYTDIDGSILTQNDNDVKSAPKEVVNYKMIIAASFLDVIANFALTIGFFYVGSGMYQVIYSSVVIWCAILSFFFLGRKISLLQSASIVGVSIGLALSALGINQSTSDPSSDHVSSMMFGMILTSFSTFGYACVYVVSDQILTAHTPDSRPPSPEKIYVYRYASIKFVFAEMSTRRSQNSLEGNTSLSFSEQREYDSLYRDSDELSQFILKGINYAADSAVDLEQADEEEEVQQLDETVRNMIDIENKLALQKDVLERIQVRVNAGRKFDDVVIIYEQECEKAFRDYSHSSEEDKYFKNENYNDFRQKIWEVKHENEPMPPMNQNEDDDLVVGPQKESLHCPITTLLLDNPVTSELCKHTFSKDAIMQLMSRNGNVISCPIPGCDKQIMEHNLKENKRLVRKVVEHVKMMENEMDDIEYTNIDD
ncbi:9781_t:CDS:10 [Funneliformis mosseae]|uniref:9781_t:CDS:1 n=1 Tax=Funneliformis mosseae TaxID=27381 RepID=A0A9N8ZYK6_FUNMO|nr:9781_t:CDS:10 [Funneliformis mosseae]